MNKIFNFENMVCLQNIPPPVFGGLDEEHESCGAPSPL
jgi:hypothetical protein